MGTTTINQLFNSFRGIPVLVVGDVMIDAYLWGKVDRISPEAPVPVVSVTRKENRLGGAANVALNLSALGAKPIICAVSGNDSAAATLNQLLRDASLSTDGIVQSEERITTVKTRIISNNQQMLRVDEEVHHDLSPAEEKRVLEKIKSLISSSNPSVIIFEDYNKGLLTGSLIKTIIDLANQLEIPTCVDPKKNNFFTYSGATLFKPNLKELREGLKTEINSKDLKSIQLAVTLLESKMQNEISLITLSESGIYIKSKTIHRIFPAHVRNIADVSGAGDTVIAVAALCLAAKTDHEMLARLSNLAGGLVCEKVGVAPIDCSQLIEEAEKEFNP